MLNPNNFIYASIVEAIVDECEHNVVLRKHFSALVTAFLNANGNSVQTVDDIV